jgi:hypothetical protein
MLELVAPLPPTLYHRRSQVSHHHVHWRIFVGLRCITDDLDLVFVTGLSQNNAPYLLEFLNNAIDGFNVGTNTVRVAVVRYTSTADVPIPLGEYNNRTSLQQAVSLTTYIYSNVYNLSNALETTMNIISRSSRSNAALMAVLLMHTLPNDTYRQLLSSVYRLQSAGVTLVPVFFPLERIENETQLLLSYCYDVISAGDGITWSLDIVNQTIQYACPLRGKLVTASEYSNSIVTF